MDFDRSLRQRIAWLNNEGGFENKIMYNKIAEIAYGNKQVFDVLKSLEAKKDEVKDPTAYVTSALRKMGPAMNAAAMMGYGYAADAYAFAQDVSGDRKLSKRIREMNTIGGFENQINYSKVMEAAQGLQSGQVHHVLDSLQQKKEGVQDPTAFVTAACRREGGGYAASEYGVAGGTWIQIPNGMHVQPSMLGPQTMFDAQADRKLRKHIAWLNNEGGFANGINYQKVLEVAQYLDIHTTMKALKYLEEKKDEVKDPTAWVTSRLRKAGYDASSTAPEVDRNDAPDRQVRRRIAWLNNEGGFGNSINYTKVNESIETSGAELDHVISVLESLKDKRGNVNDPTAFVTSGIRRANKKTGGVIKRIVKQAVGKKG
mmetsp:Transcript_25620/g.41085  ORF Transcript_25620/g.41085 Transcript_25620/m.41085 type:complete len:372 (-) Transcript_25620:20-1135(-)